MTAWRRDLHAHPETAYEEHRTSQFVADKLQDFGLEVVRGLAGTGVVGVLKGKGEGGAIGLRADMDALDIHEQSNRPYASRTPGKMHACGHDGHTAIGLGIARELDDNGGFDGTLKLFFQPAEEGGRGGKPMSETELLDDVDRMLALHLGLGEETGTVVAGYDRPLSNAKLDVAFHGVPAHAGGQPHAGRNAAQALGAAIQNLYSIPRHGDGKTRVNVGQVHSPNAQNVISERADFRVEVRGETAELNEYMLEKARRVVEHAAGMHDCEHESALYGKTTTFECDDSMVDAVSDAAAGVEAVTNVKRRKEFGGSEDASYLIRRVQEAGGDATYIGIGASNPAGHHTAYFDIDEASLDVGVDVTCETIRSL
ncbi:MAG: amidohydrolase [Halolamina sp.]